MTDLSELNSVAAADKGAVMDVLHPISKKKLYADKEQKKPMRITLAGYDSTVFTTRQRELIDGRLENPKEIRTSEIIDAENLETITRCVLSWENMLFDGKELECKPDVVKSLLKRLTWLKEDIDIFISNRANFIKG